MFTEIHFGIPSKLDPNPPIFPPHSDFSREHAGRFFFVHRHLRKLGPLFLTHVLLGEAVFTPQKPEKFRPQKPPGSLGQKIRKLPYFRQSGLNTEPIPHRRDAQIREPLGLSLHETLRFPRKSPEPHERRIQHRVKIAPKLRQKFQPEPVSGQTDAEIAGIGPKSLPDGRQVVEDIRPGERQKGSHERHGLGEPAQFRHSGQTRRPGPPQDPVKNRFGLVVLMVGQREKPAPERFSGPREKIVPGAPRVRFQTVGGPLNDQPLTDTLNVKGFTEFPHKCLVPVGFFSPELVIRVGGEKFQAESLPPGAEKPQERHTVRPSGDPDQDPVR